MIWLSQMFTWLVKKVPKSDFQSHFFKVKNYLNLPDFLSLKSISLEEGFLLLSFFENFNFWTTLSSKMVPNFWQSVWTSVKAKSKKCFHFTAFFSKIYSLLTRPQYSTTEVTLMYYKKGVSMIIPDSILKGFDPTVYYCYFFPKCCSS